MHSNRARKGVRGKEAESAREKKITYDCGKERAASQVEIKINDEIMEAVSFSSNSKIVSVWMEVHKRTRRREWIRDQKLVVQIRSCFIS